MNARGEHHGRAKLTVWDVQAIRLLLDPSIPRDLRPSVSDTARAFGIGRRTVHGILQRRIWGWLL